MVAALINSTILVSFRFTSQEQLLYWPGRYMASKPTGEQTGQNIHTTRPRRRLYPAPYGRQLKDADSVAYLTYAQLRFSSLLRLLGRPAGGT